MAGRQLGERSEEACQFLLEKLKQGQVDLHRNLEHLRSPKKKVEVRNIRLCVVPYVCNHQHEHSLL